MIVFGLVDFSDQVDMYTDNSWRLVLFNKYFKLRIKLPYKCYFTLRISSGVHLITIGHRFSRPQCIGAWSSYFFISNPFHSMAFDKGYLIDNKWEYEGSYCFGKISSPRTSLKLDDAFRSAADVYMDNIKVYRKDSTEFIDISCIGESVKYAPQILYFKWLKEIWAKLFNGVRKTAVITLSKDISSELGYIKDSPVKKYVEFNTDLATSVSVFLLDNLDNIIDTD